MLLKQNPKPETDITSAEADAWLKRNPHRMAANMTGKLASDETMRNVNRRPPTHGSDGRRLSTAQARYSKVLHSVTARLEAGAVVTQADFDGYSSPVIVSMIKRIRDKGHDVLTLTRYNKAVGWCLASTVFENKPNLN